MVRTMAEYIDREVLLQKAWDADTRVGYVQVVDVGDILDMPVADVTPLVRCKDCKYLVNATVNSNGFLICHVTGMEITPEDFCSYAEEDN